MAQHWTQIESNSYGTESLATAVALLDRLRMGPPGLATLDFLAQLVPMDYLSLVEYVQGLPRQIEGHARGMAEREKTARCFALYRSAYFLCDEVTGLARDIGATPDCSSRVDLFHYRQHDIPDAGWRRAIFVREQLAGRVSIVFAGGEQCAYALNLYRHIVHGEFTEAELGRLRAVAPLVRAALQTRLCASSSSGRHRVAAASVRLAQLAGHLSSRELEVAARIATGMTTDGIADDLGIAPSTVLTLRKRAYTKLKVHSRIALAWSLN